MNKRTTAGFTLVEILVALATFGMIALALASMTDMAFQGQSVNIGKTALASNADMLRQALQNALATASYVQAPAAGVLPSDSLIIWDNTNPDGSISVNNAFVNIRTFRQFCLQGGLSFYLYQGQYGGAWPMPGFPLPCDGAVHAGVAPIVLAGNVPGMTINTSFSRPANNILQFSYSVWLTQPNQLPPDCPSQRMCLTQTGTVILNGALN